MRNRLFDLSTDVQNILSNTDGNGYILSRERNDLEYKQSYSDKNWRKYSRTMAAFANNRGGFILFGITDKKREVIGIDDSMDSIAIEKFTDLLNNFYAPEIGWDIGTLMLSGKKVGYIYTYEAYDKPVIVLKNENEIKVNAGDILYRYRASTRKINYPELRRILDDKIERERRLLFEQFQAIFKAGTTNIGILNYSDGTLSTPDGLGLAIDKKLIVQILRKARYIKAGSFTENGGQPVLRITGSLDIAEEIPVPDLDHNVQYPYIQRVLAEKLCISPPNVQALIWKLDMKGKKKYHDAITTSKSGVIHKFSEYALQHLRKDIEKNNYSDDDYDGLRKAYSAAQKGRRT